EGQIDMAVVDSQVETIRSEKIALAVVDKLSLWQDPDFVGHGPGPYQKLLVRLGLAPEAPPAPKDILRQIAVGSLKQNLLIARVGRSYVTEITFVSLDPVTAAKVAKIG